MHSMQIFLGRSLARKLTLGVGLVQSDLFCLNVYNGGPGFLSSPTAPFRSFFRGAPKPGWKIELNHLKRPSRGA
jgi:hypothetical protein